VTLRVPAAHLPAVVEALLHLYQAKAESLQRRAADLIQGEASADALLRTRQELQEPDRALEQLDWGARTSDGPVEVTAARKVLREAAMGAIDDAGERLSSACTDLLHGEGSLAEVQRQVDALRSLLELLGQADAR
jgi:hypothetical protein